MGSFISFQFLLTLFLQQALQQSPLQMALSLLPAGLLVAFSAPFADRLIDRFGTPTLIVGGLVALSAGYLLFLRVDAEFSYLPMLLPTALLLGVGFALAFPAINVQATAGARTTSRGWRPVSCRPRPRWAARSSSPSRPPSSRWTTRPVRAPAAGPPRCSNSSSPA
ncbi:MFS transporter [Nocardiopsis sp. CNR-923]|uniref:MFS transporter n=1 Tax=Nocardiopsis sp. CNR-923 TaxID=1904965 RepID=UPI00373FD180